MNGAVGQVEAQEKLVNKFILSFYRQQPSSPGISLWDFKIRCSLFKNWPCARIKSWFKDRPARYSVLGKLVVPIGVLSELAADPSAMFAPAAPAPIPDAVLTALITPPANARLNLHCRICRVNATSEVDMRSHLAGARHRDAVLKADRHALEAAIREVTEQGGGGAAGMRHCELCGKWFKGADSFRMHVNSAQHKARVLWLLLRHDPSLTSADAATKPARSSRPTDPRVTVSTFPHPLPPVALGETAEFPITITNHGPGLIKLRSVRFLTPVPNDSMRLYDTCGTTLQPQTNEKWLYETERYEIKLVMAPTAMGLMRNVVVFDMAPTAPVARAVAGVCCPHDMPAPAPPVEPGDKDGGGFRRPRLKLEEVNEDVVKGVPPPGFTQGTQAAKVPMRHLPPPEALREAVMKAWWPKLRKRIPRLRDVKSMKQYSERLRDLLWLEELQHEIDIRVYDMKKVTLTQAGRTSFLELEVPGLAENRPSVLKGDRLLVTPSGEAPAGGNRRRGREYEGYVHAVHKETVRLRFDDSFTDRGVWIKGRLFDVRFTVNRSAFNLMQNALLRAVDPRSLSPSLVLPGSPLAPLGKGAPGALPDGLPSVEPCGGDEMWPPLYGINRGPLPWVDRCLNDEQRLAVREVVRGAHAPLPYLIFGPPGTGKTSTLVEAARQLLLAKSSHRLLLVAPSNSAADQLVQLLAGGPARAGGGTARGFTVRTGPGDSLLMRLCAFSRTLDDLPRDIREMATSYGLVPYTYSTAAAAAAGGGGTGGRVCSVNWDAEREAFLVPPLEVLMAARLRVVVTTCAMAARLVHAGIPSGHFSHVLVDEAGHAEEPLQLCALAGLAGPDTRVVMAGDPRQLGPIILSLFAKNHGSLDVSLMERLLRGRGPPYGRREQAGHLSTYITMLLHNYRSHPHILRVPNVAFYNGELIAAADPMVVNSMLLWEGLQETKNRVPLLMHHIVGKDEQEANSPSWQNLLEARQVLSYVDQLLAKRKGGRLDARDIGIISPYKKQVQRIRVLLREKAEFIKVGSVEEFQGQERKVIIISTVRSSDEYLEFDCRHRLGFLSNPKRFNVAITRAQALVVVVGNAQILVQDPHWRALLRFLHASAAITGQALPAKVAQVLDAPVPMTTPPAPGGAAGGRAAAGAAAAADWYGSDDDDDCCEDDDEDLGPRRRREPVLPDLVALGGNGRGSGAEAGGGGAAGAVENLATTLEKLVLRGTTEEVLAPSTEDYVAMMMGGAVLQVEGGEMRRFD